METKILLSKDLCDIDAVKYIASRYGTTPEKVLRHYFVKTGMVSLANMDFDGYELQPNELALFHGLGVQPVSVEII